jgi:D-sedoheptulose 7-phosphate isomerase
MSFPNKSYDSIASFADDYFRQHLESSKQIPHEKLVLAFEVLMSAYESGNVVYVCGNGGSAAISNHLVCDHLKGIQADTSLIPRVISLSSNIETAVSNDIDYADIFLFQLRTLANKGDCLITISSSGDSENIVRALKWGRGNGLNTISMTGFDGGRSGRLADINLHVGGDNYGVIEDVHQSIMHILAQYLRLTKIDKKIIGDKFF